MSIDLASVQRIALVNPTKFLGNLLLSGQLVQGLVRYCEQQEKQLLLVLDQDFAALASALFDSAVVQIVWYPRRQMTDRSARVNGIKAWWHCLCQIRAFKADLSFHLEEDSVSHYLTHLSGARTRVSTTGARYQFGFQKTLDIPRTGRPIDQQSIWSVYRDIFVALGLPVAQSPAYPDMSTLKRISSDLQAGKPARPDLKGPYAVLHAGGSKGYKKWPEPHFVELACTLIRSGLSVVLVGAGAVDRETNGRIVENLTRGKCGEMASEKCQDLCDQLSYRELVDVLAGAAFIVGNDSGPSHLGSALGVPGVVIFGPTDVSVWRPLGAQTTALENKQVCAPDCSRHDCRLQYQCLASIRPEQVLATITWERGTTSIRADQAQR